jgi:DNA-binding beta-propeller fold protein YncE
LLKARRPMSPRLLSVALAAALLAAPVRAFEATHVYALSGLNGALPSSWADLSYDAGRGELWVANPGDQTVRVFDADGMERFVFGDAPELGRVFSVAALDGGDLVVVSKLGGAVVLLRCNFRGEVKGAFELRGAPAEFMADFTPVKVRTAGGRLYLVDPGAMRVVIADQDGTVVATRDFAGTVETDGGEVEGMTGFGVAADGTMLFTVATAFTAVIVPPSGTPRAFGSKGSSPGRFNIVGGIARDEEGRVFVADTLRSVVMAFGRNLEFLGEFGYRGESAGSLVGPKDLVAAKGMVFVAQNASRGVSAFRVRSP